MKEFVPPIIRFFDANNEFLFSPGEVCLFIFTEAGRQQFRD